METTYILIIGSGLIAMVFAGWKTRWISSKDEGTDRMKLIGSNIADGAMAFLKAEYRVLSIFVLVVAILLGFANSQQNNSSAFGS